MISLFERTRDHGDLRLIVKTMSIYYFSPGLIFQSILNELQHECVELLIDEIVEIFKVGEDINESIFGYWFLKRFLLLYCKLERSRITFRGPIELQLIFLRIVQ